MMIASYITFRMVEVFLLAPHRFASKTANIIAAALAVIVIIIVVANMSDILHASTDPLLTPRIK